MAGLAGLHPMSPFFGIHIIINIVRLISSAPLENPNIQAFATSHIGQIQKRVCFLNPITVSYFLRKRLMENLTFISQSLIK